LSETKPKAVKVTDKDIVILCPYDENRNCENCIWRERASQKGYIAVCAEDESRFEELVSMWKNPKGKTPKMNIVNDPPLSLLSVGFLVLIMVVLFIIVVIAASFFKVKRRSSAYGN